jgi:hypothetical protein
MRVTSDFLPTLGVEPLFGRTFTADDDRPGGPNVVILSHTLWQKRFGADRNILDQPIVLSGTPYTVIGVMPETLKFPFARNQVWLPRVFENEGLPPDIIQKGTGYLTTLGRLKPGVSREQADEQLHVIDRRYAAANAEKVDSKAGHERLVVPRRSGWSAAPNVTDSLCSSRMCLVGCMRECCESFARSFHRPSQGNRSSHRFGSDPHTDRCSISNGECPDCGDRRCARYSPRRLGTRSP